MLFNAVLFLGIHGTSLEKMARYAGPPCHRVREWMRNAEAEGAATMVPEVAFPGLVLGFLISL